MDSKIARLRADTRRLDYLITESNEARIDWLSDSFWDALADGDDVLAAARATIDAAISKGGLKAPSGAGGQAEWRVKN